MTAPVGWAPSNLEDFPAVACAECAAARLYWIPPSQQMSDVLSGLVGCASCNITYVLESPFAPDVPVARHAPNPGEAQGSAVACPKCGGREVGLMRRRSWQEGERWLSVAFACAPCRVIFYQEIEK
jgi:hypothetical protein